MISLQEKTIVPRDGFSYYHIHPGRPDSAFTIPNGTGYANAVRKLMAYRAANPWLNLPADEASCAHEIQVFTFARLKATGELGVGYALKFFSADASDDAEVAAYEDEIKKNAQSRSPHSNLRGAAHAVSDYAVGVSTIADWLGSGGVPVDQDVAEKRAKICEVCPLNTAGTWLAQVAATVATAIKNHIAAKHLLKLQVSNEDKLQFCSACHCNLSTKIWTPLQYITDHMKDETKAKLDKSCWITNPV